VKKAGKVGFWHSSPGERQSLLLLLLLDTYWNAIEMLYLAYLRLRFENGEVIDRRIVKAR
jgi:hypothetical protein